MHEDIGTRPTTHVTFDLRDPPDGTSIERIDERGMVVVQWREAKRPPARWLAIILAWLFGVELIVAALVLFLADDPAPQPAPVLFKVMFLGALALIVGAFALPLLIPRNPESLTFDGDALHYDTGSPPLPWMFMLFLGPMSMRFPQFFGEPVAHHWYRRRRTMSRKTLGRIRLERVGERQRLTVDLGADRIEIGPALREPEREWLAQILHQWLDEGHPG